MTHSAYHTPVAFGNHLGFSEAHLFLLQSHSAALALS
jgi:hypothetical protein